jgi:hypothetical protein
MKPLSSVMMRHVSALFDAGDRRRAVEALVAWSEDSERLRSAALRVSHGDLRALADAIALGQADWRDLLVAAGFADDLHAHEEWTPLRLTTDLLDQWRSGVAVASVRFGAGSRVQVRRGSLVGGVGIVETLDRLEPETAYTIRFRDGSRLAVPQSDLREAE